MEFEDSSSESDECASEVRSPMQHQLQFTSQQQQQQQPHLQPTQFLQIQPQSGMIQGAPTLLFHPQHPSGTAFVSGIVINNGGQGMGQNHIAVINAQDLVAIQQQQLLQQQLAQANAAAAGGTIYNREVLPEVEKNRHQSEVKDLNVIRLGPLPEEVSTCDVTNSLVYTRARAHKHTHAH